MYEIATQAKVSFTDAYRKVSNLIGKRSVCLFQHGSLEIKMYAPKTVDPQTPHRQDEAYIVMKGKGYFYIDGSRIPFEPGDFLFAPAGVEHRFENFSDDLVAWVIYYGPEGGEQPIGY
ncbi:MAG: cupin domain-containing protein [Bacteroidota bacterium]